jgi:hypothetical protein
MERNEMLGTNDRLNWVGVLAQAIVLAMLVWVGWNVRELRRNTPRPAMSIMSEWTTPSGKVEKLTSYRAVGESFLEFRNKHNTAVADMGGPIR